MHIEFGARLRIPRVESKCFAPRKIRGSSASLGMTKKRECACAYAPVPTHWLCKALLDRGGATGTRGWKEKSIASPFGNTQGRLRSLGFARDDGGGRAGKDRRKKNEMELAHRGAGCCWLRQWTEPKAQTRSVEGTLTIRRVGKRRERVAEASASCGQLRVGI